MANEKPIFVQCPDCSDSFRVVFNGEEIVRCPNEDCSVYLYMSIETQEFAKENAICEGTSFGVASEAAYTGVPAGPHAIAEEGWDDCSLEREEAKRDLDRQNGYQEEI